VDSKDDLARLSSIKTWWSELLRAHQGEGSAAQQALRAMLLRYHGAAYRYLLGILRDPVKAEEKTQDFAVRFLEGKFASADPGRGRFRDYLKTALRNLCRAHWEAEKRNACVLSLPEDSGAAMTPLQEPGEADPLFDAAWRDELMSRTWEALQRVEEEDGPAHCTVLRLKTEQPDLPSRQMADLLAPKLGEVLSEAALLQRVRRARKCFADLLVAEVAHSLGQPTAGELERELIELGLLDYCKSALQRRGSIAAAPPAN
jgi:RNA polymerase sigma-70 factor (ECF subfamily)